MEGGREREREGGREGKRERGREGGREGEREREGGRVNKDSLHLIPTLVDSPSAKLVAIFRTSTGSLLQLQPG